MRSERRLSAILRGSMNRYPHAHNSLREGARRLNLPHRD